MRSPENKALLLPRHLLLRQARKHDTARTAHSRCSIGHLARNLKSDVRLSSFSRGGEKGVDLLQLPLYGERLGYTLSFFFPFSFFCSILGDYDSLPQVWTVAMTALLRVR